MTKDIQFNQKCQYVQGVYSGFIDGKVFSGSLRCNSWTCPACAPRKLAQLRKRMFESDFAKEKLPEYAYKFVTLTFGGAVERQPHLLLSDQGKPILQHISVKGKNAFVPRYDVLSMYNQMSKNFNRLLTALRNHYGKFKYFRVYEPHKDGVPHFHVLFIGVNIIPKSFRDTIAKLWSKYGQGFIKVNVVRDKNNKVVNHFKDVQHAINYLLKYLSKDMTSPGKYKRIFSAARGVLYKIEKKEWEKMIIVKGRFDDKGSIIEEVIYDDSDFLKDQIESTFGGDFEFYAPDKVKVITNRHLKHLLTSEV